MSTSDPVYARTPSLQPMMIAGIIAAMVGLIPGASASIAAEPTPFEIADRLDLVPTPREIRLDDRQHDLAGWTIVAAEGSLLVETAVEAINERIKNLGGRLLEVSSSMADGNCILVAPCTHPLAAPFAGELSVAPDDPGEQGYVIEVAGQGGRTVLLAVGCDELGTLYAAMTVRSLIQPGRQGPLLWEAAVRDWPAFNRRCLGRVGRTFGGQVASAAGQEYADVILEEARAYIRWLAEHKINMADVSLPNSIPQESVRELMDYGRRFGLKYRYIYGTAINSELEETGNPWTGCVTRDTARHCWTAFDEHQRKARKIAEHVRRIGYDYVVHHVTDSGGLPDPEKWSERCQRCRQHYGDDHARAAADQLKLYHDAIKGLNPDVLFEAVLQPYHFQWTVEGFCDDPMADAEDMPHAGHTRGLEDRQTCERAVARATAIHRAVAAALPADAMVTFREAGRREFDGVTRLWEGHPVDIWVYYGRNQAWEGLWEPQLRLTKTWFREGPRDLVYHASVGRMTTVNEVSAAGSAEYTWNVDQPDAEPTFEIIQRRYPVGGKEVSLYQRESLLPRICRRLWGRSGAFVLPLFTHNVSFNYMGQPEFIAASRGEDLADPYEYWQAQTAVLQEVRPKLNAHVAAIGAGEPSGIYGDLRREPGYTPFMFVWYYANLAALKGEIESDVLEITRLVSRQQPDEAKALAADLQARLPEIIAQTEMVKERMKSDPHLTRRPYYRKTPPGAKSPSTNELNGYPFHEQPQRIASLVDQLLRDARAGAVPEHLRQWLATRTIEAAPVEFKYAFEADGHRGEGGWTSSDPVEFFTVGAGDHLARYPTRVWIHRDDEALYLMAEMADRPDNKPAAAERPRDDALFEDDCFEVFLAPEKEAGPCCHFALSAAGSIFDAQSPAPGKQWDGQWQAGASRRSGLWTAELRIPFATLGSVPASGDTWWINLGRHRAPSARDPRSETSNIIGSPGHHERQAYRELVFVDQASRQVRSPIVRLDGVRRQDMTVTYGFATQLWLTPKLLTWRQSRDATVEVIVCDGSKELKRAAFDVPLLSGSWTPAKEIDFDLGDVVKGDLLVVVTAAAADGTLDARQAFMVDNSGQVSQASVNR